MNTKNIIYLAIVAVFSSITTIAAYRLVGLHKNQVVFEESGLNTKNDTNLAKFAKKDGKFAQSDFPGDFTEAAEETTNSVVHIMATQNVTARSQGFSGEMPDMFQEFFGDNFGGNLRKRPNNQKAQSSGSGVIISQDGYIVTNNHVVDNAIEVEVILNNKKTYKAQIIGTDPSTDLAVIKVEDYGLPNIVLGNSDQVRVGQWVLAVGNPFNLESTVTAGIVSAKGRDLRLLREKSQFAIESFIQTDAAVNPGNSGGALINTKGELIGINTAIATPTGTYAGYSFAVPVNIVRKVMKDLIEYGTVQRAFLGITISQLDGKAAKERGLTNITEGVYVETVMETGSAGKAGIKQGDVIVGIDNKKIKNSPELLEEIAKRRPGNKIKVKVLREGKTKIFDVFLKNQEGNEKVINKEYHNSQALRKTGAEFEDLTPKELKELGIEYGIRVKRITGGKIAAETNMQNGFIITRMGGKPVKSVKDLIEKLETSKNTKDGVFLSGIYPGKKTESYYAFGWE